MRGLYQTVLFISILQCYQYENLPLKTVKEQKICWIENFVTFLHLCNLFHWQCLHISILTLMKLEIFADNSIQSCFSKLKFSVTVFFFLQLPRCTVHQLTPKSGFVLRLKLDLPEILPLDLFRGDSPVKIHSSCFCSHLSLSLDKLTGFKFTRVSF